MPSIVNWECKLLGNLAGSVQIDPGDCRLLAQSFAWLRRRPREGELEYKSRIHDNWPDFFGKAWEVKEAILHHAGINRQGNPIASSRTSSLGGAGADPPQAPGLVSNTMTGDPPRNVLRNSSHWLPAMMKGTLSPTSVSTSRPRLTMISSNQTYFLASPSDCAPVWEQCRPRRTGRTSHCRLFV